jgi:hypothetical protein
LLLEILSGFQHGNAEKLLATTLLTFSPGLVHDAMMARPESFLTALALLFTYGLAVLPNSNPKGGAISGVAYGLMVSSKFTLSILIIIFIAHVLLEKQDKSLKTYLVGVFLFFSLFGFWLGAPYVFSDFHGYLDGINALRQQYYGSHMPHSLVGGGSTFLVQTKYYVEVYGLVFIFPFAFLGYIIKDGYSAFIKNRYLVLLCGGLVAYYLVIAIPSVFFERNLHPILPIFIIIAVKVYQALARTQRIGLILATFMVLPFVFWVGLIHYVQSGSYLSSVDKIENEIKVKSKIFDIKKIELQYEKMDCGLLKIIDFSDQTSLNLRDKYLGDGWSLAGRHLSPFWFLPTSTLHYYLAPNYYWLYKPCPFFVNAATPPLERSANSRGVLPGNR